MSILKSVRAAAATLFVLIFAFAPAQLWSQDWTGFRGPKFDNCFPGQKIPLDFGPTEHVLWKTPIASGLGSPCIVGDRIFLTAFDGQKSLEVFCLHRLSGAKLWSKSFTPEKLEPYFEKLGSPSTSTCASDGKHIVSYFGSIGLLCFDLEGEEIWRVDLPLPKLKDDFGSGSSPIIHDGLVYLLRDEDGPGRGMYAFDVATGKQVWKRDRDGFRVSYGSPVIWDGGVVVIGDVRAKSYDLKTGADRWVVHGLAAYPCTTPTCGSDGNLYIATWSSGSSNERNMPDFAGLAKILDKTGDGKIAKAECEGTFMADFFKVYDKNKNDFLDPPEWMDDVDFSVRGTNVVLAIKPGAKDDATQTHVIWSNSKGAPYVASPLFHDGRLYIIKDGGLFTVYEGATGKLLSDRKRIGVQGDFYASPIAIDSGIVLASLSGTVLTMSTGDKPEVLHKADFGEPISATPVCVGNVLYLRTSGHLWALGEKKQ